MCKLIARIWEREKPPRFLWDWEDELDSLSEDLPITLPRENMTKIAFDLATFRAKLRLDQEHGVDINKTEASRQILQLEQRLVSWSVSAVESHLGWGYCTVDVSDSINAWQGAAHSYNAPSTVATWNTLRCLRILTIQTWDELHHSDLDLQCYFSNVRRQMIDDICLSIPCILGLGVLNEEDFCCDLIQAYSTLWPLFLAGSAALTRDNDEGLQSDHDHTDFAQQTSPASAQVVWIIGRVQIVAQHIGLRWASAIADALQSGIVAASKAV